MRYRRISFNLFMCPKVSLNDRLTNSPLPEAPLVSTNSPKTPDLQQSTSIYDGGKAAWLTLAGRYSPYSFQAYTWTHWHFLRVQYSWMILFCTYGYIWLSSFYIMASLWIGWIEVCFGLRCIPRLLYKGILEPRDTVEDKVRWIDYF